MMQGRKKMASSKPAQTTSPGWRACFSAPHLSEHTNTPHLHQSPAFHKLHITLMRWEIKLDSRRSLTKFTFPLRIEVTPASKDLAVRQI